MTPFELAIVLLLAAVVALMWYKTLKTKPDLTARVNLSGWFDKSQPLWLPRGTVRALIVIMAMWGILFPIFKLITWPGTVDPAVKDILLVLLGALPGFVNKYMEARAAEPIQPKT